ncbi:MAG TPA: CbiX/SirB N-terminal domain-containing protein [Thermodesulfobacteriota bacterium]|nr:CbiX/SirB N-terminal domain-containing protein [Thermodesulfobacteriota bacterium]
MKALILIDHGSKVEQANNLLVQIVGLLNKKQNTGFDFITYSHMELCNPTIEDAFYLAASKGATEIIVHPYFLAPGRHSKTDIPNMVKEAASKYTNIKYKITEPLGIHDKILEVILERANHEKV